MPEQLLTILQICLLVLLYLFLARVVRAVWVEVGGSTPRARRGARRSPAAGTGVAADRPRSPARLVFVEPEARRGDAVDLAGVTTIGRAAGSTVVIDDHFLSHHHARIRASEGSWWVEDLGSTNGTYLNGIRLTGPATIGIGDRVQLGDTVLEVA